MVICFDIFGYGRFSIVDSLFIFNSNYLSEVYIYYLLKSFYAVNFYYTVLPPCSELKVFFGFFDTPAGGEEKGLRNSWNQLSMSPTNIS